MKLIDKNALVEYLERMGNEIYAGNDEYFIGQKAGLMKVVGVIMTFPTVEERKHGRWEDIDLDTSVCSVCKKPQEYETKYCPECGAKMENNGDDDDDLQAGERFYILDKDYKKMFNKTFYINKNATGTDDILLDNNHFAIYSDTLLYLLTGIAFVKKKPFCPKYGEMVYYVTVSGYIQEVRFDTDSTLHQLLRKAGKLYRSEEEAKRYLDKDYKDLIIQEEE